MHTVATTCSSMNFYNNININLETPSSLEHAGLTVE